MKSRWKIKNLVVLMLVILLISGCKGPTAPINSQISQDGSDFSETDVSGTDDSAAGSEDVISESDGVDSEVSDDESADPGSNVYQSQDASDTPSAGQSGASSASSSSSSVKPKEVKLVVWGMETNLSLVTAAAAFESKNKNTQVEIQNHSYSSINDIKMALAAGNAPDVLFMDQTYLGAAGTLGYLVDLNQYGASSLKNRYVQSTWEAAQLKGKQWGLPFDANTIAQVYNLDMMEAANASVPKTYDELRTACDKIRTRYPNAYGYTQIMLGSEPGDKNWLAFTFFNWLWRMGGDILNDDHTQAAFNSQAGIDALQMIIDMKTAKQASPTYLHYEFFSNGNQAAITNIGSWTYNSLFGVDRPANYGISLLPVLKNGVSPYSGLGLYCYAVSAGSQNPQDAYDFVEFYAASETYQLQYCKKNNFIPSLIAAHSDSFYSKPEWKIMIQQLGYSKYRPSVQGWDQIEVNLADAISLALQGTRTPQAALDAAARYANSILSRYNK